MQNCCRPLAPSPSPPSPPPTRSVPSDASFPTRFASDPRTPASGRRSATSRYPRPACSPRRRGSLRSIAFFDATRVFLAQLRHLLFVEQRVGRARAARPLHFVAREHHRHFDPTVKRAASPHVCFTFSSSLRIRSLSSKALISKCRFSSSDMRFHMFTSARFTSFVLHSTLNSAPRAHEGSAPASPRASRCKSTYTPSARARRRSTNSDSIVSDLPFCCSAGRSPYVSPSALSSFR